MAGKTSDFIDKLYNFSGVDARKVAQRYKKRALISAGIVGAGALLMPKDEKKLFTDSVTRNQDRFSEFDSLQTMLGRTAIPDQVGGLIGAGLGLAAVRKGYDKNLIQSMKKIKSNPAVSKIFRVGKNTKPEKESLIFKPIVKKITEKFGPDVPRYAVGAAVGSNIGGWVASTPFDIKQVKNDYQSGTNRYNDKKLALISATSPYNYNLGLYAAEKLKKKS